MRPKEIILTCPGCGERYDLGDADLEARRTGTRDVKCPHCRKVVAKSN